MIKYFISLVVVLSAVFASTAPKVTSLSRFNAKPQFSVEQPYSFVNTNAPKGGTLRISNVGTFDSINRYIVKGTTAEGTLICFEGMMMRSPAEPFTLYSLIAEYVQLEPDNSSITFHINPKARFSDDSPVTAEDVKYSYETLRDKGMPRYKHYFGKVESIEVIDTHTLKVTFKKNDKNEYDAELPMIICLVPVLQKQQLESIDFANSGLIPLIGTGPYKIGSFEVGRTISVVRNPDYWGKDLPLMRGQCNYDIIRVDYYKNEQAQRQAFLAGEFDVMFETNPNQFLTAYENAPAISDGRIVKTEMAHERPVAVRYFAMNMRRDKFHNWHFRKALTLAYDFDSINNIVFGKAMSCPSSLFANTFLAHKGKPQGLELEMLQGFEKQIDPELYKLLLEGPFECAKTKGNGDQRDNLSKATEHLKKGGYKIKDGKLYDSKGEAVEVEIMIKDPRLEKLVLNYKESLKKLGITLTVRNMDTVQYENRVLESDFDMIIHTWSNGTSPGAEQEFYFSAKEAEKKGSSNYIGIKDPVAEGLAQRVARANTFEESTAAVGALDRYFMHLCCQVPMTYDRYTRWLYWKSKVEVPKLDPRVGLNVINYGYVPQQVKKPA